jgi:hypothetical protein
LRKESNSEQGSPKKDKFNTQLTHHEAAYRHQQCLLLPVINRHSFGRWNCQTQTLRGESLIIQLKSNRYEKESSA